MAKFFAVILLSLTLCQGAFAMLDGIYCGLENCYEVLGMTRENTKAEISKAYRKLARTNHPDRVRDPEKRKEAAEKFRRIAAAYEVLRDDDTRQDYDYLLDNPEEFYSHYYRYYSKRYSPKVDVRIVLFVTISVISACQYYISWCRYDSAISHFATVMKFRLQAIEIAKEEGLWDDEAKTKKKRKEGKTKEDLRKEEDALIRKVIEEKMDIRGSYAKPKISDVLWLQLILLPYTIFMYILFKAKWVWRFTICREEYGDEEKLYVIRKFMKLNEDKFEELEDQHDSYLKMELWKRDSFDEWKAEQDMAERRKNAENNRSKAMRRYLKNHGSVPMNFNDD